MGSWYLMCANITFEIVSKFYVLSIFLNVFVAGTLFHISPGWTSLPCLSSLLSQIKFSILSLLISAFSSSFAGLKPPFRNRGEQNNIQPLRLGHRKALSHTFLSWLQMVWPCLRPWTRLSNPRETHSPQTWARRGQLQHLAQEMAVTVLLSRGSRFLWFCFLIATSQWWIRPMETLD